MKCEMDYCIYNRDFQCLLQTIWVNSLGMCEECILVSLDDAFLEAQKQRQLHRIQDKGDSR